jgi:hypothetical protein
MATHIKDIIEDFLKQKAAQTTETEKINRIIGGIMETQLKKHIRFNGVKDKKLVFSSNVSSARYDFNLKKDTVLRAVQKEFPHIEGITMKMAG